jgi:hypothetical protein
VCGFRSYGPGAQRLELTAPLAVVHADNSQGKTSLAEAVEFLFTGATTRRLLLGGSPSEFQDALRNAHLPPGSPVYVELGLDDGTGTVRVLRRELTRDYHGASDCISRLTLDGAPAANVTDAGLALSDPPLAAPVLLEHTLRYAVSAKPGDRSDYFKAVLEVADLDVVRTEVSALIAERDAAPRHRLLIALKDVAGVPLFAAAVDPLRQTSDLAAVEVALRAACHAAAPPTDPTGIANEPLPETVARLRQALQARQSDVLPVADLTSLLPAAPAPIEVLAADPVHQPALQNPADRLQRAATEYGQRVAAVDAATAAVLPLLQAALRIDRVTGIDNEHPGACPLCLTPAALTATRVAAIRAELADQQQLSVASTQMQEQLRALVGQAQATARASAQAVPVAARWDADARGARIAAAMRLGCEQGQLEQVLAGADDLAAAASSIAAAQGRSQQALTVLVQSVGRLQELSAEHIQTAVHALRELTAVTTPLWAMHARAMATAELLVEVVRPQVEADSDTAGWATVAELAQRPAEVAAALAEHAVRTAATGQLRRAAKEIDGAVQTVLDRRLLRMGTEVRRWWGLLRPDELTTFNTIVRRGTGRRYLDVTAALAPQPAVAGVVRNALAILSNSQLNALGLSAFLARCQLLATPLIVLDDPVPGSDREHRSTFASDVVAALLDGTQQVLVATNDSELARHLHTSHQHLGVDEFEATLVDPCTGTQLLRTGDDFERLMLDASSQMHSPLPVNRRAAGNGLRIAAERLAKHVVVAGRRRGGDVGAAVSDYDNKNLRDLRDLAGQHVVKPNEPGQWQILARVLNDADHDTLDPPAPIALKNCHSTLRQLKRQHVQNDPHFTRP